MKDEQSAMVPYLNVTHGFINLQSASDLSGMHQEMILEFIRAELVTAAGKDQSGNPYFDDEGVYRLRQIEYLRHDQQAHLRTIRLVLQLMERAEAAEREVRRLRDRV
jgi:DNA-binding transcriptional MerR regulator